MRVCCLTFFLIYSNSHSQLLTTVVGTICFPIDTVKRRLMVQRKIITSLDANNSSGAHISKIVPYKSGFDCVRRILAEEGPKGLFAGLSVNIVRSISGAVLLVAYDELKVLMHVS